MYGHTRRPTGDPRKKKPTQVIVLNQNFGSEEGSTGIPSSGEMTKAVYDTNNDGIVNSAHKELVAFINKTGATLTKGTIVYLNTTSSSGNFPEALKANASTETTSSKTIGAVYEDVAVDATGYIVTSGEVDNLNTSSYTVGTKLWLATTDGNVTTTTPSEPNHSVFIGTVTRSQTTNGRILYAIQNGYELEELHNVSSTAYTAIQLTDIMLVKEAATSIWKPSTWSNIRSILKTYFDSLYQPLNTVLTNTTASFTTALKSTYDSTASSLTTLLATGSRLITLTEITKLSNVTVTSAVNLDNINSRVNELDTSVILKGSWDASVGTFPGAGIAQAGWSYIVSVGGTIDGVSFSVNDRVIAISDNASTNTFINNWFKADYTDQVLSVAGKTGAVTLVTNDIAESTNKRYVTDAQLTVIGNTSGTNSGNETTTTIGNLINGATADTAPVDADMFGLVDSTSSNILRKFSWANMKSNLKTYFDSLYQVILVSGTNIKTINGNSLLGSGDVVIGGGSPIYNSQVYGNLYTGTISRFVSKGTQTIAGVKISLGSLPSGTNVTVDVRKNGMLTTNSIFTSDTGVSITTAQSATNGIYISTKTTIDNGSLVENDVIYVVVTSIGSTVPGADLEVIIY